MKLFSDEMNRNCFDLILDTGDRNCLHHEESKMHWLWTSIKIVKVELLEKTKHEDVILNSTTQTKEK